MRMSMGESADGEISPYPPEKLSQVLYTGVKGFDQKYSLVPPDILSGNSSNEASRPSTPRSKGCDAGASGRNSRTMSVGSNDDNQQTGVADSRESMMSGKPPQFPVHSGSSRPSADGSRLSTRNRKPSGTGSEDDIEILDKQSSNQVLVSADENLKHLLKSRTDASNRLGSNDSDIAVIGDQTEDPKVEGATTDTVFDPVNEVQPSNLASALSDAASRMQHLSPVAELTNNVSNLDTSSGSDNDIHIHANYPATHDDVVGKLPQEQLKNGDSPTEHSSTESQMSDSIYSQSRRRRSSTLENVAVDFSQVDHRLKLYFDMELFGDDEEFRCLIKVRNFKRFFLF